MRRHNHLLREPENHLAPYGEILVGYTRAQAEAVERP